MAVTREQQAREFTKYNINDQYLLKSIYCLILVSAFTAHA